MFLKLILKQVLKGWKTCFRLSFKCLETIMFFFNFQILLFNKNNKQNKWH